jgi:PKD repeat protein
VSAASTTIVINNVAPVVAALTGATIAEGGSFTTAGSFVDPGTGPWTATVDYGDGSGAQPLALAGKAFSLAHSYADNGTYTVTVTVSEAGAASATATATVTVTNVAPTVAFTGGTILRTERYTATGSFADPGTDTHTATVDYGDGSGTSALSLTGGSFSLDHAYLTAGTYTVTVTVTDEDGGTGSHTAQVVVQSAQQGTPALVALVNTLNGTLGAGEVNSLQAKLSALGASLRRENDTPARNQIDAFVNEVNALVTSGRLTAAQAAPLLDYAARLRASIGMATPT